MPENLGLVALAQIQALEARPQAEKFRATSLGGKVLDADGTIGWLRQELSAAAVEDQFDVRELDGVAAWRAFLGRIDHGTGSPATQALAAVSLGWVKRYGWTLKDSAYFALTDTLPVLPAVEGNVTREFSIEGGANISGPLSERITLVCRPQATVADVTRAYQEAQARLLRTAALAPRERTKPMTSWRRVALAVMGGRIYRQEFKTWAAAMAAYNAEHLEADGDWPDGSPRRDVTYRVADTKGRFRKDTRDSFKQATGLDLDFQPQKRRGSQPNISLELPDDLMRGLCGGKRWIAEMDGWGGGDE